MPAPAKKMVARPLTLDEKIDNAKVAVADEVKRIKISGWIFVSFGLICILSGVNEMFDSRRKAAFIA